ncbi:hypothetical protein TNCV_2339771 [Trichonephila clavipes]|nr:hypothetical protein TNCV_2339771 [Trichonephila clavipes]
MMKLEIMPKGDHQLTGDVKITSLQGHLPDKIPAVVHSVKTARGSVCDEGRSSLVVKIIDPWQHSIAEDSPCREVMHVKSVEAQTSSRGVVWKLKEGVES